MSCNNYNRSNGVLNNQNNYSRTSGSTNTQNSYMRSPLYRGNSAIRTNMSNNNINYNDNSCRDNENYNNDYIDSASCPCQNSDCQPGDTPVDGMIIAMSYVPWQQWNNIYNSEEAFNRGTIFASLYKPWIGRSISNE